MPVPYKYGKWINYTIKENRLEIFLLNPFNWILFTDGLLLGWYLDRAGEQESSYCL